MAITISEFLLLEEGDHLLLEDGSHIVLSDMVSAEPYPILNIPKENKTLDILKQGESIHIPERTK